MSKPTEHTAESYYFKYLRNNYNSSLNRLFRYLRLLKKEQGKGGPS